MNQARCEVKNFEVSTFQLIFHITLKFSVVATSDAMVNMYIQLEPFDDAVPLVIFATPDFKVAPIDCYNLGYIKTCLSKAGLNPNCLAVSGIQEAINSAVQEIEHPILACCEELL